MYKIDKSSEIFFYGYSQFDLVVDKYILMLSSGYNIRGFIDKRAREIGGRVPCMLMGEFISKNRGNTDVVIIILLQNGMQHEKIAESFFDEGYKKILFLPADMDTLNKTKMYAKYNAFLEGEYNELCDIPEVNIVLEKEGKIRQIVKQGGAWYTCYVPTEILYSYKDTTVYGDEDILFCLPYKELYDFLTGKLEACSDYLAFMEKHDGEAFLEDRRKLFKYYEYERTLGMDYFVETAAYVSWNERGYFNIIDGHHRVAYLAYMGYRQIPVRIKEGDFIKWQNRGISEIPDYFWDIPCPVPLPFFLNQKNWYDSKWKCVIEFFYFMLMSKGKQELSFIEADKNLGYYARYYSRAGWGRSYVVLQEEYEVIRCQELNHWLRQEVPVYLASAMLEEDVQSAYVDMDLWEDEWIDSLLTKANLRCLVFEISEEGEKKYLQKVQNALHSSIHYVCQCDSGKIYGIIKEENNGRDYNKKFEKKPYCIT